MRRLLLLLITLLPILANAYDAEIDGIYYNFIGDEAAENYQIYQNGHVSSDYSGTIVIPESVIYNGKTYSVASIGVAAFQGCYELTFVTIPYSVTMCGDYAFSYCKNLKDVYCYAEKVPSSSYDVFEDTPISSATLHVPASSVNTYKEAYPWNNFKSIVAL